MKPFSLQMYNPTTPKTHVEQNWASMKVNVKCTVFQFEEIWQVDFEPSFCFQYLNLFPNWKKNVVRVPCTVSFENTIVLPSFSIFAISPLKLSNPLIKQIVSKNNEIGFCLSQHKKALFILYSWQTVPLKMGLPFPNCLLHLLFP